MEFLAKRLMVGDLGAVVSFSDGSTFLPWPSFDEIELFDPDVMFLGFLTDDGYLLHLIKLSALRRVTVFHDCRDLSCLGI